MSKKNKKKKQKRTHTSDSNNYIPFFLFPLTHSLWDKPSNNEFGSALLFFDPINYKRQ